MIIKDYLCKYSILRQQSTKMKKHLSLVIIALCLPFILWAVCGILPTFDDYTSLQSPWWVQIADPGYFFPDSIRRPFDALLGGILGWQPALFPTLNHVLIILGHTASACLVFALCQRLKLSMAATNIATLFFFFSPATLGATLACDGFNQTYAQLWGLLALWTYLSPLTSHLSLPTPHPSHKWLLCVLMAVLSKENGLAWAVVPPLVAYAFRLTDRRQTLRDVCKGLLLALAYMLVFATLALTGKLGYAEEYSEATLFSHVKDLVQLLAYTWVPLDYVSAVYPPTRNMSIVAVTALMTLPFLLLLACRLWRGCTDDRPNIRCLLLLTACFFILVSPHLITVVSIMHNYAALSIAAIIVAVLLSSPTLKLQAPINQGLFALFLAAALFTDVHHYIAARESGLLGKKLAMQAVNAVERPPRKAFVISIDDPEEPRYSSFCVRPVDAFAWGLSVRYYSHYEWNTHIDEVTLPAYDRQQVGTLADSALQSGCEAVWVAGHDKEKLTIIDRNQ